MDRQLRIEQCPISAEMDQTSVPNSMKIFKKYVLFDD